MQTYPRSLDLVWPGQLHGTGCLSARAMDTGFPTVVWCLCLGPGCGWVWVSVTPPVLAGVLGGCVWVRFVVSSLLCRLGFVVCAVGLGLWPAPHLSWLGIWDVRDCVRAPPAPRRSRFRCAVWACLLGSGFRLRPATLWGVLGYVCARVPVPRGLLHLLVGGAVRGCVVRAVPRHHSKPHQPQRSRPRGQTGTTAPKHATRRQLRATRPSTTPQSTTGNSTTHSGAPQNQASEPAQTTQTAQRTRTSTTQRCTAQSAEDRERTARQPRTHTAYSTAANNSMHQHTTTKNTQHRAQSTRKHQKTQHRKAQHSRATESARGHNTTSSGTKRLKQNNTAHNSTTPGGTTRSNAAQHSTWRRSTAQHTAAQTKPDNKPQREQGSRTKRPETRHNTQRQPTAQHNTHKPAPKNTAQRAAAHNTQQSTGARKQTANQAGRDENREETKTRGGGRG